MDLQHWLGRAVEAVNGWSAGFGPFTPHPSHHVGDEEFGAAFADLTKRLQDNYPFFHPRYVGQMVKPPHPAAIVGYLAAMLVNPNNHAREGGPATADMEREVIAELAAMFGLPDHLGHLTTSGTMGNLEALYVARESHPGAGVAYSADSHFTHARMCRVLGMAGHSVPVDLHGRMDLDALEALLRRERIGTVVLTAGTTGTGAVDPVHGALALKERYGVRLHVDAAYGGFFTLLAGQGLFDPRPWEAIPSCDSVVVDPHKHGLQPYGCGAVLFADPAVARHYRHDSPYTYFTESDLHLGEISLECSRSGAAAAALWLTLRLLPATPDGLGRVLLPGLRAARRWAGLLQDSPHLTLFQPPELDIVTYFPSEPTLAGVDAATARVLNAGMAGADPVYVSALRVDGHALTGRHPRLVADAPHARVLRSVLIKPEAGDILEHLHRRLEELAGGRSHPCPVPSSPSDRPPAPIPDP
ncbi:MULTISPECIES: pyridoxal phosphate-dependent decarboxylase family protein [Streptosporangium]|uniref:Glutamate/tyrosine decarboxylase-like PLP-dependent enzyme n=1 Tax=Streptosporangium brasiliense TaxID=47480 RepID=A0ABT9R717_9ACTN|nr:aminotransferase class V-fold PLP-dependent enzyme [Streptosporangium brasiliense]MDP9864190.1 glutamate/tyrosine decarboxylase-like PLP-dependent enzyme [Streptosporangium brasiliense]